MDLAYLFNHVFLPPKLPHSDDSAPEKSKLLTKALNNALSTASLLDPQDLCWSRLSRMMRVLLDENADGSISTNKLEQTLLQMEDEDVLALEINAQNAGLIIRRAKSLFIFESFELSSTSESVTTTLGRLQRLFPGPAIAVDRARVLEENCLKPLTQLISQLDAQTLPDACPTANKSKSKIIEVRDTVSPLYVTEMLSGILRAIGQPYDTKRICKRVRDEVLWESTEIPWRRSPRWLLLRVAIQTTLSGDETNQQNGTRYKQFMVLFLSQLLDLANSTSTDSNVLFVMATKVSRRMQKLGQIAGSMRWAQVVKKSVLAVQQTLTHQWNLIQRNPDPLGCNLLPRYDDLLQPSNTVLSMTTLNAYLKQRKNRKSLANKPVSKISTSSFRIKYNIPILPPWPTSLLKDTNAVVLATEFEIWVQENLSQWTAQRLKSDRRAAILSLGESMKNYQSLTNQLYKGDPRGFSFMVLTLMDLWVSLDKLTLNQVSLLQSYSPGFPLAIFDVLVLPKKKDMERLHLIEQYLKWRSDRAEKNYPSIFTETVDEMSFAVRFFDQSEPHQALKTEIETQAAVDRLTKLNELTKAQAQCSAWTRQADAMGCVSVTVATGKGRNRRFVARHANNCPKHQLLKKALNMEIKVHEWPLSSLEAAAKATVFELDVPKEIWWWRETTYRLLTDLLSPPMPKKEVVVYPMAKSGALSKWANIQQGGRIDLVSTSKETCMSHYKVQKVSGASQQSICMGNSMRPLLYDSQETQMTSTILGRCSLGNRCNFRLPTSGSYSSLQFALDSTSHTSNDVLAAQDKCSASLTLHEFYAFGILRSGHRLQWRNIARTLVSTTINFSHMETYLLVTQAAWQVGKGSSIFFRESHIDLAEEEFGFYLLGTIEDVLLSVESNWMGTHAVRTLIILTTRLLSLTPFDNIQTHCLRLLQRLRKTSVNWLHDVVDLMQQDKETNEAKSLERQAMELALLCHTTFDIEKEHLESVLTSPECVAWLIESMITVNDLCSSLNRNETFVKMQLDQFYKRAVFIEPVLLYAILRDRTGIEAAIRKVWPSYESGGAWKKLSYPFQGWMEGSTSSKDGRKPMALHFNLLRGDFLVDRATLSKLPGDYTKHLTYQRLFGHLSLEVVPSSMAGMAYESRRKFSGRQVHFMLFSGGNLSVRMLENGRIKELIPPSSLESDFPQALIEDFVLWFDPQDQSVEFRPKQDPWGSITTTWRTTGTAGGDQSLIHGEKSLKMIDVRSQIAAAICQVLSPIEQASHIQIMLDFKKDLVEIHLPRLNLDFSLKQASTALESKQFRGMVVDENQSLGAFNGLMNKLVLRNLDKSSRMVIVPDGEVTFSKTKDHVRVDINNKNMKLIPYHHYQIDEQLGRLVDNGSLRSRLYKIYLHALTSYCLVDKLTGRTGTEEALHGLALSSTKSFLTLEPAELDLLEKISKLAPSRTYYPAHLKVMQRVTWNALPFLSQHERFRQKVEFMEKKALSLIPFQESAKGLPKKKTVSSNYPELYLRAALRQCSFRVDGFGGEDFDRSHDEVYIGRDEVQDNNAEFAVFSICRMVDTWSHHTLPFPELLQQVEQWGTEISGPCSRSTIQLGFDAMWLEPHAEFLPSYFCQFHQLLAATDPNKDKYKVMIFLATLAFSGKMDERFLRLFLSFATKFEMRSLLCPSSDTFNLGLGYEPVEDQLSTLINSCCQPFEKCPEAQVLLPSEWDGDSETWKSEQVNKYEIFVEDATEICMKHAVGQWPTLNPSLEEVPSPCDTYLDLSMAEQEIRIKFQEWHSNVEFQSYIMKMGTLMEEVSPPQDHARFSLQRPQYVYEPVKSCITFQSLLRKPAPLRELFGRGAEHLDDLPLPILVTRERVLRNRNENELSDLLDRLALKARGKYEEVYIKNLRDSFDAFEQDKVSYTGSATIKETLEWHLKSARTYASKIYQVICSYLEASDHLGNDAFLHRLNFPRLSPEIILSQLATSAFANLNSEWKLAITHYGVAMTTLQRAERLIKCAKKEAELLSELQNSGHDEWDPLDHPDWLLLELENNILIRPEQARMAKEMIQPSGHCNSIMQLNMGLGKSSVIVPIVASTLADKQKLVRVVVLRSLSTQMYHLLVTKLGGMINRQLFFLPISRSLKLDLPLANFIQETYKECLRCGGVLLVQPEHILSFELLGFDKMLDTAQDSEVGKTMVETQNWLFNNTRDILDESDEILNVRFELIYTMGSQKSIDFSPDRWNIIEQVLGRLAQVINKVALSKQIVNGLELLPAGPGEFPRIRLLNHNAAQAILSSLASNICEYGLPTISVCHFPPDSRTLLLRYLTNINVDAVEFVPLEDSIRETESLKDSLLLLRGLFAGGILKFALSQKRWRVNYGLDPSRTKLAVPFDAKDSPAARAEFSHPDTAIILTCLSYYYGGLSDEEIFTSFEKVQQCEHAQEEYDEWTRHISSFPKAYRKLGGINLSNKAQCSLEIFPLLKRSKGLIDYYMSCLVFPKEMKEYSHKLSASGWEIGREKNHSTTGFSGTNDSRYVLPISVKQSDLLQQRHTNADTLYRLLRHENSVDGIFTSGIEILSANILLKMAVEARPPIRVILDVGAQVLELRNEEVAHKWLSLVSSDIEAAIYVDDRGEICVLTRSGTKETLSESPYAKQMDRCIVYLDEAHTRGTDLTMPANYRALVTLGADLTKDRLAQACLRMRKLGQGQSVVFCGPREIQVKILEANSKDIGETIEVKDVLSWCVQNTWETTRKSIPLWATQGMRHYHRRSLCLTSSGIPDDPDSILEPEAQTLEYRYGISKAKEVEGIFSQTALATVHAFEAEVEAIKEKCEHFNVHSFRESALYEEQERELQPESERERHVERPVSRKAHAHRVYAHVRELVAGGELHRSSDAFIPAFRLFDKTSANKYFASCGWPNDLLVTRDFARTVEVGSWVVDEFLRPVNWIISGTSPCGNQFCIIMSPYEVNELLPSIRKQDKLTLHVYAPRLTISNNTLEGLRFCSIPKLPSNWKAPTLTLQINLFAGQLYLQNMEDYVNLCRFLGLSFKAQNDRAHIHPDGFVRPRDRRWVDSIMASKCNFSRSPVAFLRAVTCLRRKNMKFETSHMGRILNGEMLREDHFVVPSDVCKVKDADDQDNSSDTDTAKSIEYFSTKASQDGKGGSDMKSVAEDVLDGIKKLSCWGGWRK